MFEQSPYQTGRNRIQSFFAGGSTLSRLILINAAVFLLANVVGLFYWLFAFEGKSPLLEFLAVPADLSALVQKPWTILTYMFYQEDFFHILFNLIVLYFGGRIFQEFLGDKRLTATYLFGGIAGALFFIFAYNFFPVFEAALPMALALGASASVLAILVAAASYVPEYRVPLILFGNVKLKHIAIVLVVIDLLSIRQGNPGGHIAHLGGAVWGFVSVWLMRRGLDFSMLIPAFSSQERKSRQRKKWKVHHNPSREAGRPLSDEEYNAQRAAHKERMDAILDKISKYGYARLTEDEKAFLFRSGQND
jgi:membrane associated rhomboid family serine protease